MIRGITLGVKTDRRDPDWLVARITTDYPESNLLLLNFFRSGDKRREALKAVADRAGSRVLTFEAREHVLHYGNRGVHPDWRSHASLAPALEEFIRATPPALRPL